MSDGNGPSARDVILARIREALRMPAPPPHGIATAAPGPGADRHAALTILPEEAARPWLPDGGETPAERRTLLLGNLERLRAIVHEVSDLAGARDRLATIARERGWQRVAWHPHPLVEPLLAGLPGTACRVDAAEFDKNTLESCDAGITSCEALVAQTGSLLVSSTTSGGRGLSILPHTHVVVATADQIVATLADALHATQGRHDGRLPSMLSFITGPSRTGDIERILVLGAHGPKELILLLVG